MKGRFARFLLVAGGIWSAFGGVGQAEDLPTLSIRYMSIEADVILVGVPVDSKGDALPTKYKVMAVLKGPDSLVGKAIEIRDDGTCSRANPRGLFGGEAVEPPPEIVKAMLFLHAPRGDQDGQGYTLVLSGIRALTDKGDLLVPQQQMNPGPQYLLPMKNETWDATVEQVKEDLPTIEQVLRIEAINDSLERNRAIFAWIDDHKNEFRGGYFGSERKGWASLEPRLFGRIMESCIPEDCWKAKLVSAGLGSVVQTVPPSFCSKGGRALLVAKVMDTTLADNRRLMALEELGSGSTYWYAHRHLYPRTEIATKSEQAATIDLALPLLTNPDPSWRRAAARCVFAVSHPYDANFKDMTTKRAVPDLVKLYRTEKNAAVRDVVVDGIRRLESDSFWHELTGNPDGIVAFLRFVGIRGDQLEFDVRLDHTRAKIVDPPAFRFRDLRDDVRSTPVRSVTATVEYPKDLFKKGWEAGQGSVTMRVPVVEVEPGAWCVTLEGRLGESVWRSESVDVTIPESPEAK